MIFLTHRSQIHGLPEAGRCRLAWLTWSTPVPPGRPLGQVGCGEVGEDHKGTGGLSSVQVLWRGTYMLGTKQWGAASFVSGRYGSTDLLESRSPCVWNLALDGEWGGSAPCPQVVPLRLKSQGLSHRSELSAKLPLWASGTISDKTLYSLACPWVYGVCWPSLWGAPGRAPLPCFLAWDFSGTVPTSGGLETTLTRRSSWVYLRSPPPPFSMS